MSNISQSTMKAVRIHKFGGPEVLIYEDTAKPVPDVEEVLVKIHAAGINPADWKFREGFFGKDLPLPITLGFDFSGVVDAVGSSVTHWKKGDQVYAYALGAFAEYISISELDLVYKPKKIDHIHAAAIPSASLIAWKALFEIGDLQAGQKILIHAAAGGVGSFAVQLAHLAGAYVIGTASARNHDYLRELGANEVIDYQMTKFEEVVKNVDMVLDTMGGDTQTRSYNTLKPGGILLSIVSSPSIQDANKYGVRATFVGNDMNAESLTEITKLIDAEKLKVTVDSVYPLAAAGEALAQNEAGHTRGKIVLKIIED